MSIKKVFGRNLKNYRKQSKLSQEELAERIDVTPQHLSHIECGHVFMSAELLEKITRTLGVSASAMFYSTMEKSADTNILSVVDQIIERELANAANIIKLQIRQKQART
ncbi:hypothetical protein RsTz2092_03570 [Deferribacterales bacterium RsTz2092]|nr:hypothetical protein AGMMS49941_03670 [Deferribacterales bacterium]GHU84945.1 hypothetical protein AGMMS49941_03800 [Deferribacterales bacterium]